VTHDRLDSMACDPIEGHGHGYKTLKVGNSSMKSSMIS